MKNEIKMKIKSKIKIRPVPRLSPALHLVTVLCLLVLIALRGWSADAPANSPSASPLPRELRVGVTEMPPFTMKGTNGQWEGLSVDLWKIAAARTGWNYRLQELGHDQLVEAVSAGRVDLALSPAPITLENEELADFTHSYYSSGLCVAVAHREPHPWRALLAELLSANVLLWIVGMVGVLLAVGTAVWLAERRANEAQFGIAPRTGIGDGIWWAAVTLTTVGYGDKVPRTSAGRLLGVLWLFVGVFLLAAFTGHVSSTLTLQNLGSPIQNPQDLSRYRIGAITRSAGAEYLASHHIRSRTFPNDEAALTAVSRGELTAMVASEPLLRYRLHLEQSNRFDVLPFSLDRRDYAILLPNGSALREPLNRQILHAIAQPEWRELLFKYFEQ